MNRNIVEENWKQIRGEFQTNWAKLTADDIEATSGKFEALVGALQSRYGLARDVAERDLDAFITGIDAAKLSIVPTTSAGNTAPGSDAPRRTP